MTNDISNPKSKLEVRNARISDVANICELTDRAYKGTGMEGYSQGAIIQADQHLSRGSVCHLPG